MMKPGRILSKTDFKFKSKGVLMKLLLSNKDCEVSFEDLPFQIVLFADTVKHIAAHAIKGPSDRYCAYIECPVSLAD